MKQKIEKWQRWIVRIREQMIRLMMYRSFNQRYEEIVNRNPRLNAGNSYLVYFRATYADFAAMAVRRQAKEHKDSFSLLGLLEDMKENPAVLTREWFRELFAQPLPTGTVYPREQSDYMADVAFKRWADASGKQMDVEKINADIAELEKETERVVTYADRALAHDDRGGTRLDAPINFNDLDKAIQCVERIGRRYNALLTGQGDITWTPTDLTGDVQVFRIPWLAD